jgi:Ca2+-transporting ATPase
MGSFLYGLGRYGPTGAGTMAFLTLTSAQLLHVFRSHADTGALYERSRITNPWIGLSAGGGFLTQGLAGVVPPLRRLLGTTPVTVADAVLSWALAALSFAAGETVRLLAPPSRARGSVERRVP